jgi:hypothetical protein
MDTMLASSLVTKLTTGLNAEDNVDITGSNKKPKMGNDQDNKIDDGNHDDEESDDDKEEDEEKKEKEVYKDDGEDEEYEEDEEDEEDEKDEKAKVAVGNKNEKKGSTTGQ